MDSPISSQAWSAISCCAAAAAATASEAARNTAQNESPTVLKTQPLCPSITDRNIESWRASAPRIRSGNRSHNVVLPSMSVNKKVWSSIATDVRCGHTFTRFIGIKLLKLYGSDSLQRELAKKAQKSQGKASGAFCASLWRISKNLRLRPESLILGCSAGAGGGQTVVRREE